jgi:hypothetical protein
MQDAVPSSEITGSRRLNRWTITRDHAERAWMAASDGLDAEAAAQLSLALWPSGPVESGIGMGGRFHDAVEDAYHAIIQKRPADAAGILERALWPQGQPPHVAITMGGVR